MVEACEVSGLLGPNHSQEPEVIKGRTASLEFGIGVSHSLTAVQGR